jgi:MFS superfamily sulfate permease-like transporter
MKKRIKAAVRWAVWTILGLAVLTILTASIYFRVWQFFVVIGSMVVFAAIATLISWAFEKDAPLSTHPTAKPEEKGEE